MMSPNRRAPNKVHIVTVNDSCREDSGGGGGGHHHYTSSRGDPIQVVDLDHDAEISITGTLNVLGGGDWFESPPVVI